MHSSFPGQRLGSASEVVVAMKRLNWRPRQCLGFLTPFETFVDLANTQNNSVVLST